MIVITERIVTLWQKQQSRRGLGNNRRPCLRLPCGCRLFGRHPLGIETENSQQGIPSPIGESYSPNSAGRGPQRDNAANLRIVHKRFTDGAGYIADAAVGEMLKIAHDLFAICYRNRFECASVRGVNHGMRTPVISITDAGWLVGVIFHDGMATDRYSAAWP